MSGQLPAFTCPVGGCEVEIPAMSEQVQLVFLQTHIEDAHERLAVTGLEKRVEATDVVKESSDTDCTAAIASVVFSSKQALVPALSVGQPFLM